MGSASSAPEPQILGPVGETPPPRRKPRPSWAVAPATYALVGANCAVFLAMLAHGISFWMPTVGQLLNWGADDAGLVLYYHQWWRLFTAMFVHVGFLHILLNMWCLWNLGVLAEPLMGATGVVAVYVLTGAAGDMLSTFGSWWMQNPEWVRFHDIGVFPVGAGASGAIFGIAGALILLLNPRRLPMVPQDELRKLRRAVIYFAAINLVLGFGIFFGSEAIHSGISVDNWAHVGGFTSGLLFAAPMVPRLGASKTRFTERLRLGVAVTVGALGLFAFFLVQLPR
ncbi:MAG TPA: rhomboid family intramembrane serine protease [Terracidiphilus sp.]|nr:rhomboid family intramembrane serine protease [Terracidiphilus sp.]